MPSLVLSQPERRRQGNARIERATICGRRCDVGVGQGAIGGEHVQETRQSGAVACARESRLLARRSKRRARRRTFFQRAGQAIRLPLDVADRERHRAAVGGGLGFRAGVSGVGERVQAPKVEHRAEEAE